jgi:VWFA-related protein
MRVTRPILLVSVALAIVFFNFHEVSAPRALGFPRSFRTAADSDDSQPDVQVLITIASKRGDQVPPPATSKLSVRVDKREAEVTGLRSVKNEPLIFSLLVDGSGSLHVVRKSQTAGAIRLFKALSKQGNRGYLIVFRSQDGVDMKDHVVDAITAERVLEENTDRRGSTKLYDAIAHAVRGQLTAESNRGASRRAVFVFTDGGDNNSENTFGEALTLLQREGIPLFAISTPAKTKNQMNSYEKVEAKKSLEILGSLSRNTGGELTALDEPGDFVSEILANLDSQYVLSFRPVSAEGRGLHSLQVKSSSKDFRISAPSSYFTP